MNPQEQNKEKAPFQTQAGAPGIQKNESPKQSLAADAKTVKPSDEDETDDSTTKGSYGTK